MGQWRFCSSTIRSLKKHKDAAPFLHPVDPAALGIPHYPTIVRTPMDLSTIERKLNSSNPSKPDPNPENPRYFSADEFIADVRLVGKNCLLFNGADHPISAKAQHLEEVFEKQIKNLPLPVEVKPPPIVKKVATPPPPAPVKKAQPPRRASTSMPVIRRSDATEVVSRPKREIHPPPPKDLPYADIPKKRKTRRVKDDGTAEQLKFCANLLSLLHRKQHYAIASPFYEPVDHVLLDIPSYPKIVKKPMDLSTMRKKLDNHEYPNALKFYDDFKLMIRNCFAFNPAGNLVNQAGIELQRLFDEKWQGLPPLHEVSEDDDEDEESEDEDTQRIALMESQIELMRGNIQALKGKPKEKKKKEQRREKGPIASSSKSSSKQVKGLSNKKLKGKKPISDNDVLTFEQKKDLSEAIAQLEGAKLERVIKIIHEGVPEIKDSTEEIELEIDLLPTSVLTKLYNFVLRPLRAPATKRNRTSKGGGTGGLKRKSMDEDVEAEKIRMLETRMALFEQGGTAAAAGPMGEHSSDSSSGSDSSGSDSE
ncbi:Bromodomain-containing protein [Mycena haematopus]|nr:Bromodomain-containing protein [Mycena haematopus]